MPLDDKLERIDMNDNKYLEQRRNRKKFFLRIRLVVLRMIHRPLSSILLIPFMVLAIFMRVKRDIAFTLFDVPQFLFPMYSYAINILVVLLPLIFLVALIETMGDITAKKDEADLQEAFNSQELRNGRPILMNKKHIKGGNVVMREFYSNIPMKTWLERREEIADSMNVHFVEEFRYGGKHNGKRIVMYTSTGRRRTERGKMYDEEF